MIWSVKAVAELSQHVRHGLTSGEIAELLGCSRSAVVGKCYRMGLKLRGGMRGPVSVAKLGEKSIQD